LVSNKLRKWNTLKHFYEKLFNKRFEPTKFLFSILFNTLYCQPDLNQIYYSLIIKTTSSVHFTAVQANLIERTTSFIEFVVLKRCIIVVCVLLSFVSRYWVSSGKIRDVYYYTDWGNIDEFCCQKRLTGLLLKLRILAEILLET